MDLAVRLRYLRRLLGQACDFRSKSIWVPLEYGGNRLLSDRFVLNIIAATIAIAILAILTASKALTVEFQAARVLAIAILFPSIV
jgi:hypothetical protein